MKIDVHAIYGPALRNKTNECRFKLPRRKHWVLTAHSPNLKFVHIFFLEVKMGLFAVATGSGYLKSDREKGHQTHWLSS
jgi:hypothetical protein